MLENTKQFRTTQLKGFFFPLCEQEIKREIPRKIMFPSPLFSSFLFIPPKVQTLGIL
jgi:hypothetical protein